MDEAASENKYEFYSDQSVIQEPNIIVAGITGAGKSTLINAVFRFDDIRAAKTGTGKPITEHIDEYHDPNVPIRIWDTVGLELDAEKTAQSIRDIKSVIAQKAEAKNHLDVIHAIWYCINSSSSRYQDAEYQFIKELHALGVPFIIVLTKCIDDPDAIQTLVNEIEKVNTENGMTDIKIIPVLAKDYPTRRGPIESFGLAELIDATLEGMPDYMRNGFIAAQRVDKSQKRVRSEEIIYNAIDESNRSIWSKAPLINGIIASKATSRLMYDIGIMYNMVLPENKLEAMIAARKLKREELFEALWNPFKKAYKNRVDQILARKQKDGFDANPDLRENRVSWIIVVYGYAWMDTIEDIWNDYTEETLKLIQNDLIEILRARFDAHLRGDYQKDRSLTARS